MKNHLKYLLLTGALLALVGCDEETLKRLRMVNEAQTAAITKCMTLGGVPSLDTNGRYFTCDFSLVNEVARRRQFPAEVSKGGDTQ